MDVMHEASDLESLGPSQEASSALERLSSSGTQELPVLRDGRFAGLLSYSDILRYLRSAGGPVFDVR